MANGDANTIFLRHPEFYGDSVIFLVENCLFKVPQAPFQTESTIFRDMFFLPQGGTVEGLDDERPIKLDGITKDEFEQLLRVLLHRNHGASPQFPTDVDQWISVLKLSTLWEFKELREAAVKHLWGALHDNPVDRVVLATQYSITPWLLPSLNELAQRAEPMGVEEANLLGMETAFAIASVREKVQLQAVEETMECDVWKNLHTYNSKRLVVGSRDPGTRSLDFTPLLRAAFNL